MADLPTSYSPTDHTSLKLGQRHRSKLHAEYYISLMILPRSPDSVSLFLFFFCFSFPSVFLSRSLSLVCLSLSFFYVNASNSFCLLLPVSYERKGTCSRNESKMHKRVIFLEELKVNFNILFLCNIISRAPQKRMTPKKWSCHCKKLCRVSPQTSQRLESPQPEALLPVNWTNKLRTPTKHLAGFSKYKRHG